MYLNNLSICFSAMRRIRLVSVLTIIVSVFVAFWFYSMESGIKSEIAELSTKLDRESFQYRRYYRESTPKCELPQVDPWDASIKSLVNRKYHPLKDCHSTPEALTVLKNGTLKLTPKAESEQCWYRCLLPATDSKFIMEDWHFLNISAVPNCDIVETQCNMSGKVTNRRIHTQIVPQQNQIVDNISEQHRPSVFILVFDSVSRSSGIRSIPETLKVLTEKYRAFDFRGLNKVGLNSLPNGYAFLNGIRIEELPPVDLHIDENLPSEKPNYCHEYLDNSTFIGRNFTSADYVSFMAEDWASGVFNYPECYGFEKKPVTHYMRPFQLRLDQDKILENEIHQNQCKESYETIMEYQKQFLKAYPVSKPKFSVVWFSDLAHDHVDGLFHVDRYFADFFRDFRSHLSDSFVFVMGDHGMRFGRIRQTKVGQVEDGNPLLFVAVPEFLANYKQLMENMRTNAAERLLSHFDIYTTLLDIVAVAPKTNWTDFSVHNWNEKEGLHKRQSSILRPLDPGRNCSFLHISESYCICETNQMSIPNDNEIAISAAKFLSLELMKTVNDEACVDLIFKEVIKATVRKSSSKSNDPMLIYKITFAVSPSDGNFQADVMSLDQGFRLLSPRISRLNSYGNSSHCISDAVLRPICYCRDML